ncbi:hypothetical protein LTR04_003649 [Oleoguttula sp. CCFEE 6159]|nr:hypothetical protein LTR04_003649 [Oleoguttula sp. CCFEE 6159]
MSGLDAASVRSNQGRQAETPESSLRRERAAIAAQACETCRPRKSKCDEQRPKCGLCRRLNVDCRYREPQPTKKDKTMVHILETLQRLENKFDRMSANTSSQSGQDLSSAISPSSQQSSLSTSLEREQRRGINRGGDETLPSEMQKSYQHLTAAHKILLWPYIYIHLLNSGIKAADDLQFVLQDGTPWFIQQELSKHPNVLPYDIKIPSFSLPGPCDSTVSPRISFPSLSYEHMHRYTNHYFNAFNVLYPILDREQFLSETLPIVIKTGFGDGDYPSVIALLVFALGKAAELGTYGEPISVENGIASGIRGGSLDNPPGIEIFNEVRRRIGFVMSQCNLENVQINLLQAWYHLDLDLPQTGICDHEDNVPLPTFVGPYNTVENLSDEQSHFQYHFLAIIAIRRLITRIHHTIFEASNTTAETSEDYGGPPVHMIKELARQLESWRNLLPHALQWSDSEKYDFPSFGSNSRRPTEPLFAPDQGAVPINHKYNLDTVTAQLRTRFYYARFMIYRPFVYKALHFAELMTADDVECTALCIESACCWPLAMPPTKNKKRLVPYLFAWTQNFLGILLILRMSTENPCLRQICEERVNRDEMETAAGLMLDWIRDIRQVDGIAEWSWKILEPLYDKFQAGS